MRYAQVDADVIQLVPEEYARQHSVMPIGFDTDGSLRIATKMPNDFQLSTELSSVTGRQIKFVLVTGGRLEELIEKTYASGLAPQQAPDTDAPATSASVALVEEAPIGGGLLGQDVGLLPAVQAVDLVTLQAVKRNASDIHMVPSSGMARVLFRLDGVLQEMVVVRLTLHETMVARIKVLAEMDISETRRPQDGNFSLMFGENKVEFRVSGIGTTWGEMMVIRVLNRAEGFLTLEALGLDSTPLRVWRQLLSLPFGMVLVSVRWTPLLRQHEG